MAAPPPRAPSELQPRALLSPQACLVSCFQQLMVNTCSCGYYFYPLPAGAQYCSSARHPAWGEPAHSTHSPAHSTHSPAPLTCAGSHTADLLTCTPLRHPWVSPNGFPL